MQTIGIIMNGVTRRMGMNQHLIRSIVAIRRQGGVPLANGEGLYPNPSLVGRNKAKLRQFAESYGIERYSTDLERCLTNPEDTVYVAGPEKLLWYFSVESQMRRGLYASYSEMPMKFIESLIYIISSRKRLGNGSTKIKIHQ